MGAGPQDVVAQVKGAVDIVEVAQDLLKVELRRSGDNYKALCPFHREKTPSFSLSRDRQTFHCFGCGKGGDVFTLVQELERLSFREALEVLAARAGIRLDGQGKRAEGSRLRLLDLMDKAARFYDASLRRDAGRVAREYLGRRGLSDETVQRFRLGFAPDEWRALLGALRGVGFKDAELLRCGLVKAKEGQTPYDLLRNRIVIPIRDGRGRVIAFGGRVLGDGEPKYLNSPETELFSKRNVLFGLDQAEAAAKEQGHFVVVEGYMDVIAAHQRGVSHVVGTLGTSLTREHARAMARVASRAVLLFDGDAGGQRAADRGAAILLQEGLDVSVVSLPQGLDPDDWFRDHDAAAFADFVASAGEDLIDYMIRRAGERNGSESLAGRGRAVREVMEAAAEVTDPVLFDLVVKRVAGAFGLDEGVVRKAGRPRGGSPWTRRTPEGEGGGPVPAAERGRRLGWEWDEIYVLGGVLTDSALASRAADELSLEDFQDAGRRGVFQQALNLLRAGRVPTSSVILETIGGDSAARGALTDLIAHEVPRGDSPAQALQRLLRRRDEEEYRRVRDTVSGAASRQDEEAVNEVLRRVSEFHRRRVARPSGGGTREAEDRAAD